MSLPDIRIAIVGVGNCASSLVQGITHYRRAGGDVGLMRPSIGGLKVGDIRVACAVDVDARKVGRRVGEAIFSAPNSAAVFCRDVEDDGAMVVAGPVADGVAAHLKDFPEDRRAVVGDGAGRATLEDVLRVLKETRATVLVNYLPVGSQKGTELYAEACLRAGIGMVNCIPVFIASDAAWAEKFRKAALPIVGDDIKSQFGATITHRMLMKLAQDRGMTIDSSYQLNVGGNTDFLNMLEKGRLASKKISKTEAVTSLAKVSDIHIGPSDYVAFLNDKKVCYVRMNVRGFGGLPMELDMKLLVEDSPNSAGVVVDAVRCCALARAAGIGGPLKEASAVLMKHPMEQMEDSAAAEAMDAWIAKQ